MLDHKFKVGDTVVVQEGEDKFFNLQGTVYAVDTADHEPYLVIFEHNSNKAFWYRASSLRRVLHCSNTHETATGTKNDSGKLRFDLLPADSIQEVVQVITYGETKYPSVEIEGKKVQNWKVLPDNENRLFAATMRHLWQHRSGELLDQETKLKHLAHAASSLMFLINIENEKAAVKQAENES